MEVLDLWAEGADEPVDVVLVDGATGDVQRRPAAVVRFALALNRAGQSGIDGEALGAICRPIGTIEDPSGELCIIVIEPRGTWSSGRDFDRRVVAAGLWRYARPVLAGDVIPPGRSGLPYVVIEEEGHESS
jgi:hypothetical protein